MLHVNILRWLNLICSLSRDIGQYPMIEISNLGYCFHRKMSSFATNNPLIKSVILFSFGMFTCSRPRLPTKTIDDLMLRE